MAYHALEHSLLHNNIPVLTRHLACVNPEPCVIGTGYITSCYSSGEDFIIDMYGKSLLSICRCVRLRGQYMKGILILREINGVLGGIETVLALHCLQKG